MLLVRRRRNVVQGWCEKCFGLSEFASFEDARALISGDAETVGRLTNEGKLHLMKAPDESLVICFPSILDQVPKLKHEAVFREVDRDE